jgi:hypothetical protein
VCEAPLVGLRTSVRISIRALLAVSHRISRGHRARSKSGPVPGRPPPPPPRPSPSALTLVSGKTASRSLLLPREATPATGQIRAPPSHHAPDSPGPTRTLACPVTAAAADDEDDEVLPPPPPPARPPLGPRLPRGWHRRRLRPPAPLPPSVPSQARAPGRSRSGGGWPRAAHGGCRRSGAPEEGRRRPGPAAARSLGAVERGEQRHGRPAPVSFLSVLCSSCRPGVQGNGLGTS